MPLLDALRACLVALAVCQTVTASGAVFFGPPDSGANLDGNSEFDVFARGPARFQQVYDSTVFESLVPAGGGWIYEIDFRPEPSLGRPIVATVGSVRLNMSTTQSAPDGLNPIFDQNTGNDDHVVFGPGTRSIFSAGGFSSIYFLLAQPFFYNPANGDLLLDFRIYGGIGDPFNRSPLDAFNVVGDSVSSLYAIGTTPELPTLGQASTLGLATRFHITPVPEPPTLALLTVGLVSLAYVSRKRMKQRKEISRVAS